MVLQRLALLVVLLTAVSASTVPPVESASPFARGPGVQAALSPCSQEDGWRVRRGQDALASLRVADSSGYDVVFLAERDGYYGLTRPRHRRVEVYVRPCHEQSPSLLQHVVAHELGHAYDAARLTDRDRSEWRRARGISADTPWYGCSGCTDFGTPAGDFAEVYAQWQRRAPSNKSTLGSVPTAAEVEGLAATFFAR